MNDNLLWLHVIHKIHYYWAAPFRACTVIYLGFQSSVQKNGLLMGGKTRGSGTKKRCSHKWFRIVWCTLALTLARIIFFVQCTSLPQKPRRCCESIRLFVLFQAIWSYESLFKFCHSLSLSQLMMLVLGNSEKWAHVAYKPTRCTC